jgi:hypothetical protein
LLFHFLLFEAIAKNCKGKNDINFNLDDSFFVSDSPLLQQYLKIPDPNLCCAAVDAASASVVEMSIFSCPTPARRARKIQMKRERLIETRMKENFMPK